MKLILGLLILALACAAQTSVTVTITVPSAAVPVLQAWLNSDVNCAAKDSATPPACIQRKYDTVSAFVKAVLQDAVNAQLVVAAQWAIDTNDASLPAPIKAAITARGGAEATINAGKTATVQVK